MGKAPMQGRDSAAEILVARFRKCRSPQQFQNLFLIGKPSDRIRQVLIGGTVARNHSPETWQNGSEVEVEDPVEYRQDRFGKLENHRGAVRLENTVDFA